MGTVPWGVGVHVKKPPDIAVAVHQQHTRHPRVLFDQTIERRHIAPLESIPKLDGQGGSGRHYLRLVHRASIDRPEYRQSITRSI
jgi:hypothetical protein